MSLYELSHTALVACQVAAIVCGILIMVVTAVGGVIVTRDLFTTKPSMIKHPARQGHTDGPVR